MSHLRKTPPEHWATTRLGFVTRNPERADSVTCKCGWHFTHARDKVREDAIDRHLTKRHDGQGVRL